MDGIGLYGQGGEGMQESKQVEQVVVAFPALSEELVRATGLLPRILAEGDGNAALPQTPELKESIAELGNLTSAGITTADTAAMAQLQATVAMAVLGSAVLQKLTELDTGVIATLSGAGVQAEQSAMHLSVTNQILSMIGTDLLKILAAMEGGEGGGLSDAMGLAGGTLGAFGGMEDVGDAFKSAGENKTSKIGMAFQAIGTFMTGGSGPLIILAVMAAAAIAFFIWYKVNQAKKEKEQGSGGNAGAASVKDSGVSDAGVAETSTSGYNPYAQGLTPMSYQNQYGVGSSSVVDVDSNSQTSARIHYEQANANMANTNAQSQIVNIYNTVNVQETNGEQDYRRMGELLAEEMLLKLHAGG